MATHVRKTEDPAPLGLWAVPDPPKPAPVPSPEPKPAANNAWLAPEALTLVEELAAFGVVFHPETACKNCLCPFSWPLQTAPGEWLCCRCYPRSKLYGAALQIRISALYARVVKM